MATYTGRIDGEPNPHHDESHLAYALARDIEFGHFDTKLSLLAKAVEERQRTVVTAAVVASRVQS